MAGLTCRSALHGVSVLLTLTGFVQQWQQSQHPAGRRAEAEPPVAACGRAEHPAAAPQASQRAQPAVAAQGQQAHRCSSQG